MKNLNIKTLNLIKSFEDISLTPYTCPTGHATIGWGSTYYPNGVKVTMNDKEITRNQAEFFLLDEVGKKSELIESFLEMIQCHLNDNQFGALISFAYNCGQAPIIEGGRSMNIALRSHNLLKVADTFLIYNKGTILGIKRELKGLTRRRKAERDLFLS